MKVDSPCVGDIVAKYGYGLEDEFESYIHSGIYIGKSGDSSIMFEQECVGGNFQPKNIARESNVFCIEYYTYGER